MGEAEAVSLSDFLVPMLAADPLKRQGAKQMLDHPWLRMRTPEDEIAYCEMVSPKFDGGSCLSCRRAQSFVVDATNLMAASAGQVPGQQSILALGSVKRSQ